jgi:membrane associated rhomboid family serine protease
MAFEDRDYNRAPGQPAPGADYAHTPRSSGSQVGHMGPRSVTTWLIIINVAVYILDHVIHGVGHDQFGRRFTYPILTQLGYFSVDTAIRHLQVWRFITFQFLHSYDNILHLLFNMIGLYFFGPLIEYVLGSRRYLAFYLICGIGGPIMDMLLWMGHVLVASPFMPLVGASAGIFGILIAAAQIAPDATVLIYGILPMRLRVMAWLLLGIAVFTVFTQGHNAGGEAAHLGGAILGWLLIRNPRVLNFFAKPSRRVIPR